MRFLEIYPGEQRAITGTIRSDLAARDDDFEQWRKDRASAIGGSDVATLWGVSSWSDDHELWLQKTARSNGSPSTFHTRRGQYLEPWLLHEFALYTERVGDLARMPRLISHPIEHPDEPRLRVNVDGWLPDEQAPIECKATHRGNRAAFVRLSQDGPAAVWNRKNPGDVAGWFLQVQAQMACTGATHAWISAYFGSGPPIHSRIERSPEWIENILSEVCRFWSDHVQADVDPDPPDELDVGALIASDNGVDPWERQVNELFS